MNMDTIPLEEVKEKPTRNGKSLKMTLFGIPITKCEYANAEKINQLIEWNRELQERVYKLENR